MSIIHMLWLVAVTVAWISTQGKAVHVDRVHRSLHALDTHTHVDSTLSRWFMTVQRPDPVQQFTWIQGSGTYIDGESIPYENILHFNFDIDAMINTTTGKPLSLQAHLVTVNIDRTVSCNAICVLQFYVAKKNQEACTVWLKHYKDHGSQSAYQTYMFGGAIITSITLHESTSPSDHATLTYQFSYRTLTIYDDAYLPYIPEYAYLEYDWGKWNKPVSFIPTVRYPNGLGDPIPTGYTLKMFAQSPTQGVIPGGIWNIAQYITPVSRIGNYLRDITTGTWRNIPLHTPLILTMKHDIANTRLFQSYAQLEKLYIIIYCYIKDPTTKYDWIHTRVDLVDAQIVEYYTSGPDITLVLAWSQYITIFNQLTQPGFNVNQVKSYTDKWDPAVQP